MVDPDELEEAGDRHCAKEIDAVLVEGHDRSFRFRADAAREQHGQRIGQRREQRQQRGRFEQSCARSQHDDDADETDAHRRDPPPADRLTEHGRGQRQGEQRHGEIECHRIGERQRRKGHVIARVSQKQQERAAGQRPEFARKQRRQARLEMHEYKQDRRRDQATGRNDLGQRIFPGHGLDDRILQRKNQYAGTEIDDAERSTVLQAMPPWMEPRCTSLGSLLFFPRHRPGYCIKFLCRLELVVFPT
jgi:hypothetical protein